MKIEFVKNAAPYGFGYMMGAQLDCSRAFAKEMVELGLAIELDDVDGDLPADFPGRKALVDNGFKSIAEIKRIATIEALQEIKGIGKNLAAQIIETLNAAG